MSEQGPQQPDPQIAARDPAGVPKRTRGFDFSGYKRASLERRIRKRMEAVGVADYSDYLDYLEVHQDEFPALFDTILINVTGFFRDPPAWEYYTGEVIPRLLDAIGPTSRSASGAPAAPRARRPTRWRWCSPRRSGTEAYLERVKIYATEVDEDALNQARQASYGREGRRGDPGGPARALLRAGRPALHVPQGPAAHRHLRAQRPHAGRADLAHRPADLPQHADVLQRGDAGADPQPLPLRAEPVGLPVPRQVRDAHHALGPVPAGQPQAPRLREGAQADAARPPAAGRAPTQDLGRRADRRDPRRRLRGRPRTPRSSSTPTGSSSWRTRVRGRSFGLAPTDVGRPLKDLELSYRPVDLRSNLELAYKRAPASSR